MGGWSAERDISLKSGAAVADSLIRQGYQVTAIDTGSSNIEEALRRARIELVFVALHGLGGEDGAIQGFLEVMNIPYTGSGVAASVVGMNKVLTKAVLKASGLPTPPGMMLTLSALSSVIRGDLTLPLSFPVVVKPVSQGSSIGVSIVHSVENLKEAYETAMQFCSHVMIEQLIDGAEFTVGIIDGAPLPVLEILITGTLFDFDTKYDVSPNPHAIRATIASGRAEEIQTLALRVHQDIGCRGASRVDIRVDNAGNPFVLEINTSPGMTRESLLPLAAYEGALPYDDLVEKILLATEREAWVSRYGM